MENQSWIDFYVEVARQNGEAWRKEFLASNKTYEERIKAILALRDRYNQEWFKEMQKTFSINAPTKEETQRQLDDMLKELDRLSAKYPELKKGNYGYLYDNRGYGRSKGKPEFGNKGGPNDFTFDFSTNLYGGNRTADQLIDEIKKSFIVDTFGDKGSPLKNMLSSMKGGIKDVFDYEKGSWRSDIKSAIDASKRHALGSIGSILSAVDPRGAWERAKNDIRTEVGNTLAELRRDTIDRVSGVVNDTISDLRDLGSKYISGVKMKAKDWVVRQGQGVVNALKSSFGPMAKKLSGVVPDAVARALAPASRILGGGLTKLANKLGLGSILGIGGSSIAPDRKFTGAYDTSITPSTSIQHTVQNDDYLFKTLTGSIKDSMESQSLLSFGNDLRSTLMMILEDMGHVPTIGKSLSYSRNFHFVQRPNLETESTGVYRTYAFFTRPNLNLIDQGEFAAALDRYPQLKAIVARDPSLYAELCREGANKSYFFKLLNNYIKEIQAPRLAETLREGVQNMHGKSSYIPGVPEIYDSVDIQVTFIDNDRLDIANLLYMLAFYKDFVSKQGYPMRDEYIKNKGVDWFMSLWIVLADVNWNYINLATGFNLTIAEPPTNFAQFKLGGLNKSELGDDLSVTFKATSFIPKNDEDLDIFNFLAQFNPKNLVDTRGYNGHTLMADGRARNTITSEQNIDRGQALLDPTYKTEELNSSGQYTSAIFQYPGVFEMLALSPGIYRLPQKVHKDGVIDKRPNLKFGWSW